MPKNTEKELEKVLKALANQRRLKIVKFLIVRKEASVGTIAAELKLSFKATSKHLAILVATNILDKEQRSTTMIYYISAMVPAVARKVISTL